MDTPQLKGVPAPGTPQVKDEPAPETPYIPAPETPQVKGVPAPETPQVKDVPVPETPQVKDVPTPEIPKEKGAYSDDEEVLELEGDIDLYTDIVDQILGLTQRAIRIAIPVILLCTVMICVIGISIAAFLLFYWMYIPTREFSTDIFLQHSR